MEPFGTPISDPSNKFNSFALDKTSVPLILKLLVIFKFVKLPANGVVKPIVELLIILFDNSSEFDKVAKVPEVGKVTFVTPVVFIVWSPIVISFDLKTK